MASIITLTTDFGLADEYVGVMKGVILCRIDTHIVDLTHSISPYDIKQAAYSILISHRFFPSSTVHVIVVDPGVGSDRNIVALSAGDHIFLAPDNGVLTLILQNLPVLNVHRVINENLFLKPTSTTFHGRDIFSPVAALLATGTDLAVLGPEIDANDLTTFTVPSLSIDAIGEKIIGAVIGIDNFGNVTTNITRHSLTKLWEESCQPAQFLKPMSLNGFNVGTIHNAYHEAEPGEPLVLFNSRNYLELAVNRGNGAIMFDLAINDSIVLSW